MSMTSNLFLIFLLSLLVIYYLVPHTVQWIVLLAASYVYYLAASAAAGLFLIYSTFVSWLGALGMERILKNSEDRKEGKKAARKYLILCLILDFGMLAFLKYTNFLIFNIGRLFHSDVSLLHLILPLGISYYTFQTAGYLLDVYWGRAEAEKNCFRFALFVSFFPQMVQGPIGRFEKLAPQLYTPHYFDRQIVNEGIIRIAWGLFKKMILAEWAAVFVDAIFAEPDRFSGIAVFGLLMYTVQLYGDFSGGIDVMLGVSCLFGIRLDENFRQPFFAVSISDFWQRWHITLGTWMKDYLMYPLTLSRWMNRLGKRCRKIFGKKKGRLVPVCISNLIVFFVVGIWHGASWNNIGWGLYNGVIIALSSLLAGEFALAKQKLHINDKAGWYHGFMMLRTFILINISWYFDCADSFGQAMKMMRYSVTRFAPGELLEISSGKLGTAYTPYALLTLALGCLALLIVSILREKGIGVREKIAARPVPAVAALSLVLIVLIPMFGPMAAARGFLYAQF